MKSSRDSKSNRALKTPAGACEQRKEATSRITLLIPGEGEPRACSIVRSYVFTSERRASFRSRISAHGGQGGRAKFTFPVHSHMLRHACGFKLANDGHDTRAIQAYLGHRSIMSTVRYTALTPNRFKNFWKD